MFKLRWPISFLLLLFVASGQRKGTDQDCDPKAGVITEIQGQGEWRKNGSAGATEQLDAGSVGRCLHLEEEVKCGPRCIMLLQLGFKEQAIRPSESWYTIPWVPDRQPNDEQKLILAAVNAYGRLGGRARGSESNIISPFDNHTARATKFVIRWLPWPDIGVISLRIRDLDGRSLWEELRVAGRTGELDSKSARRALEEYQKSRRNADLSLVLDAGDVGQAKFKLLPLRRDIDLEAQLAVADKHGGLMRYIARSYLLSQFDLVNEAVAEYEAAVCKYQASPYVAAIAAGAEHDVGDLIRARNPAKQCE